MATSARKLKITAIDENQLQLLYGEDALTKYWSSSLFNTVYLQHDISEKNTFWKDDDNLDFQNFMNTLRNLAAEYDGREKELSNWSETETINNWVKHVLHALGWTNNCIGVQNPFLEETSFRYLGKTYRTDILIVDHPKEKQYINQVNGDEKLVEARQSILIPVEVKYWNRLEEYRQGKAEEKKRADNESDDIVRSTTPNEQTVQYMEILKKNWGILTDGARWRLFHNELSSEDSERFYEFNLASLFQSMTTEKTEADSLEIIEASKYFYHFFSKFTFYPKNGAEPFIDELLHDSKKYVNKVEEDLKDRFVKAMNIACNGFFRSAKDNKLNSDLPVIRNISESLLFNILFIKSLESRGVLPMSAPDYKKISLSSIIDKIERFDPEKEDILNVRALEGTFKKGNGNSFTYDPDGFELHDRILRLTGVIHKGASAKDNFGFEIAGFRESIFSDEEWKLFKYCKIANHDWTRILFELGYAKSDSLNRKYQQIPYAYFTPRQLGSIYESFLEYKLDKATDDMVFEKKQWKAVDLESKKYRLADLPKVKKSGLFFTPDNKDRKATGSYYTPDYIVQNLTRKSIDRLVQKNSSPEDILKLKVCDPAMGSGHFLVAALNYLTKIYLVKCFDLGKETTVQSAKNKILASCMFGVDINSRAVKLAKMSLWLETAHVNYELEDLSDQIKTGDTLIEFLKDYQPSFSWKDEFPFLANQGFDLIIGNPPYISMKKFPKSEEKRIVKEFCLSEYKSFSAKSDYFCCFIERFLGSKSTYVKKNGIVSFVLSKTFLAEPSFQDMRDILWRNNVLAVIIHDPNAFSGVGVRTASIIVQRSHLEDSSCSFFTDEKTEGIFVPKGTCDQKILEAFGRFIQNPEPENIQILTKIGLLSSSSKFLKLKDMCLHGDNLGLVNGVQTGDNGYWIVENTKSKSDAEEKFRELGHKSVDARKYYFGQDVNFFTTKWNDSWINYLPKEMVSHSSSARPRSFYYDPKHCFYGVKEKILNSFISSEGVCCDVDIEGKIVDNNVNMIIPNPEFIGAVELCGLLNSSLIGKYLPLNLRTNLSISQSLLMDIPIVKCTTKERSELKKIVEKVQSASEQRTKSEAMKKLNSLVFKLYGLTEKEQAYVEMFIKKAKENSGDEVTEEEGAVDAA